MARATAAENRVILHTMDHTQDAYMRGTYGEVRCRREIRYLMSLGCDTIACQAVMRSKWPRWAEEFKRLSYLVNKWPAEFDMAAIASLVLQYDDLVELPG